MDKLQKNICNHCIRKNLVWLLIVCLILVSIGCYHHNELYEFWLESGGKEDVTYTGVKTQLTDTMKCQLCGKQDNSMMNYYSKFNTLGIISVNDWNILELAPSNHDENGMEIDKHSGTRTSLGTTEEYHYEISSIPSRGIVEINITLLEGSKPNVANLQKRLCQECLDEVLEMLNFDKWKYEKNEALPLCLIDFQTMKLYSLQKLSQKIYIDNYYIKSQINDNKLQVEAILTN